MLVVFAFALLGGCSKGAKGTEEGTLEYFKAHLKPNVDFPRKPNGSDNPGQTKEAAFTLVFTG